MKFYQIEYSEHSEGTPLWVAPTLRACPACKTHTFENGIQPLSHFKKNPEGLWSEICEGCLEWIRNKEFKQRMEERAVIAIEREKNAQVVMEKALIQAHELAGRKTGHGFGDFFEGVCAAVGGREKVRELVGKVLHRSLERAMSLDAEKWDIDRGVKVCEQIIKAAATEQKTGKPINWRDITEQEQRDILMEPARALLLSDKKFKEELINDPEVRKALLSEVGVEMMEEVDAS